MAVFDRHHDQQGFTALGGLYLVHKDLTDVKLWNFKSEWLCGVSA